MQQNIIDRAIGWVLPEAGLRRVRARITMSLLGKARAMYDGASASHRNASRRYNAGDANSAVRSSRYRLAYSARDLERNSALGNRILTVLETEVVGAGIIPSVTGVRGKQAKAKIEGLLKEHCDTPQIDATGRQNLYGLQALAFRAAVRDGESLMVRRRAKAAEGLPLPFQISVLEMDYLDPQIDGGLSGGGFAIEGVEFDRRGKVVAYHLFDHHPGDAVNFGYPKSTRHQAENVVHLMRIDRPGQAHGVSWFAPVIVEISDLDAFKDAQLVRQKVAALFAGFRRKTSVAGDPEDDVAAKDIGQVTAAGNQIDTLEPGIIEELGPGEEIDFNDPPSVGDFDPFIRVGWRSIALGMGISYEALTGDLSQVNFASGRMGHLSFQRNIDSWREKMVLPQMCWKIGQWLLDGIAFKMKLPVGAGIGWTPPRREMIDPGKELKSADFAASKYLISRSRFQRSLGIDPEDEENEIVEEERRMRDKRKRAGLLDQSKPENSGADENDGADESEGNTNNDQA